MIAGRRGFSLLEVILAMAILLGAIVVLGELARNGRKNAAGARDWTQAELMAETLVAEVTSGVRPAEPIEEGQLESFDGWRYSIALEPVDEPGLVALEVTVAQDLPEEKRPVRFTLVRWIHQPSIEETTTESADRQSQPANASAP